MALPPQPSTVLRDLADPRLMALACEGDTAAFAELHRRHVAPALAFARRLVGDRHRAHDVVQDAFLDAWRMGASYRPELGEVRVWLMTIVKRRAIDLLRRESRAVPLLRASEDYVEPEACDRVEETAIRHDTAHDLRRRILGLPQRQRRALALSYYGGLSHSEIAARMDVPLGTAKGAIRCGLAQLRTQLA